MSIILEILYKPINNNSTMKENIQELRKSSYLLTK